MIVVENVIEDKKIKIEMIKSLEEGGDSQIHTYTINKEYDKSFDRYLKKTNERIGSNKENISDRIIKHIYKKSKCDYLYFLQNDKVNALTKYDPIKYMRVLESLGRRSIAHSVIIVYEDLSTQERDEKFLICYPTCNIFISLLYKTKNKIDDVLYLIPYFELYASALDKQEDYISSTEIEDKVEFKNYLLMSMIHDLKGPLTSIIGMAQLITPDINKVLIKEYSNHLLSSSNELASLIDKIILFSKGNTNDMLSHQPLSIEELTSNVISHFEKQIKNKKLNLNKHIQSFPKFVGDEYRISQILSNLISNSIKYTDSGYISISVTGEKTVTSNDKEEFYIPGKWKVQFVIADTGKGITKEDQVDIFNMFTDKGSGLGLPVCKAMIEKMGGNISVKSDGAGKGSAFTFHLYLEQEIDIKDIIKEHSNLFAKKKILVIINDITERVSLMNELITWGCIPINSSIKDAHKYACVDIYDFMIVDKLNVEKQNYKQEVKNIIGSQNTKIIGIGNIEQIEPNYLDICIPKMDYYALLKAFLRCLKSKPIQKRLSIPFTQKTKLRILIADDDSKTVYTLREMLKNLGYNKRYIFSVQNGEECVEFVNKHAESHPIDIVLMDIKMPNMDGIDASRAIKKLPIPPIIIIITGFTSDEYKEKCKDVGIENIIYKPLTKEKIEIVINPSLTIKSPMMVRKARTTHSP